MISLASRARCGRTSSGVNSVMRSDRDSESIGVSEPARDPVTAHPLSRLRTEAMRVLGDFTLIGWAGAWVAILSLALWLSQLAPIWLAVAAAGSTIWTMAVARSGGA